LEIVEREHFFDLSVMKKEMRMVGEVEDEVFGLLNRVDLMIMNKFRGEMRDGVSKRYVHPESLMMSLFLEGGEILDRNHVEYDEGKEDEYLLGSGLEGFEYELERSERRELRLILLVRTQDRDEERFNKIEEKQEEIKEDFDNLEEKAKNSHDELKVEVKINQEEMKGEMDKSQNFVNNLFDEVGQLENALEEEQELNVMTRENLADLDEMNQNQFQTIHRTTNEMKEASYDTKENIEELRENQSNFISFTLIILAIVLIFISIIIAFWI